MFYTLQPLRGSIGGESDEVEVRLGMDEYGVDALRFGKNPDCFRARDGWGRTFRNVFVHKVPEHLFERGVRRG